MDVEVTVKYLASSTAVVLNTRARTRRSKAEAKRICWAEHRRHIKSSHRWRVRQMKGYSCRCRCPCVSARRNRCTQQAFVALPVSISGSGDRWPWKGLFSLRSPLQLLRGYTKHRCMQRNAHCLMPEQGLLAFFFFETDAVR